MLCDIDNTMERVIQNIAELLDVDPVLTSLQIMNVVASQLYTSLARETVFLVTSVEK